MTDAVPALVVSCVDVAVITAVPSTFGVNIPEDVIVPSVAPQVTAELYDPVPCTVAVHEDVSVFRMDAGEQFTEIEVIVDGAVTATVAEPDLVESCVEVAMMVAVPAAVGVKAPVRLIVPIPEGLAVQLMESPKFPVPDTVEAHADV